MTAPKFAGIIVSRALNSSFLASDKCSAWVDAVQRRDKEWERLDEIERLLKLEALAKFNN